MKSFKISLFIIIGCFMSAPMVSSDDMHLASKKFHKHLLKTMETMMEGLVNDSFGQLLDDFAKEKQFENFAKQLREAREMKQLETKCILMKQLIDVDSTGVDPDKHFLMVRNMNFLQRFIKHFKKLEEDTFKELRDVRMYLVCQQFRAKEPAEETTKKFQPYSLETKLVPFDDLNIGNALEKLNAKENHTVAVDLKTFGEKLYLKVKDEGSEIIDDYLALLKMLLEEVINEKAEREPHSEKLTKLLFEADSIMSIEDFYSKRQRLYSYLENGLVDDFEQFSSTEVGQKDIVEIMEKLKAKGFDIFLAFLFSNFQYLEHLHTEWRKLLPEAPIGLYDEQTLELYYIHHQYNEFKKGQDSYDNYIKHVESLFDKTSKNVATLDQTHVFELFHNASKNLGTVTLNMIKEKCENL